MLREISESYEALRTNGAKAMLWTLTTGKKAFLEIIKGTIIGLLISGNAASAIAGPYTQQSADFKVSEASQYSLSIPQNIEASEILTKAIDRGKANQEIIDENFNVINNSARPTILLNAQIGNIGKSLNNKNTISLEIKKSKGLLGIIKKRIVAMSLSNTNNQKYINKDSVDASRQTEANAIDKLDNLISALDAMDIVASSTQNLKILSDSFLFLKDKQLDFGKSLSKHMDTTNIAMYEAGDPRHGISFGDGFTESLLIKALEYQNASQPINEIISVLSDFILKKDDESGEHVDKQETELLFHPDNNDNTNQAVWSIKA